MFIIFLTDLIIVINIIESVVFIEQLLPLLYLFYIFCSQTILLSRKDDLKKYVLKYRLFALLYVCSLLFIVTKQGDYIFISALIIGCTPFVISSQLNTHIHDCFVMSGFEIGTGWIFCRFGCNLYLIIAFAVIGNIIITLLFLFYENLFEISRHDYVLLLVLNSAATYFILFRFNLQLRITVFIFSYLYLLMFRAEHMLFVYVLFLHLFPHNEWSVICYYIFVINKFT